METEVGRRLQSVELGPPQEYKSIVVLPMLCPEKGKCNYLTLGEALNEQSISVTEVSDAVVVPFLLVMNRGRLPVLLVDGEELAGAKQNRVLNTSILVKEGSKAKVPVSCTEHGRWSYASAAFEQSGNLMAHKMRARKARSVSESLLREASYESNQDQVWDDIQELQAKANAQSPTSAMKDVFGSREEELSNCDKAFQCVPGQVGLLVLINGRPVGLDWLSLESAYKRLHTKLVRSYALEALLEAGPSKVKTATWAIKAQAFLREIVASKETRFPSVGYGTDRRFTGKALGGTALVHADEVIHAAFFRLLEEPSIEGMASLHKRRRRFCE